MHESCRRKAHVIEPAACNCLNAIAQFLIAITVGAKETEVRDRREQLGKLVSGLQRFASCAHVGVVQPDDSS
jgi:hypothetical protein